MSDMMGRMSCRAALRCLGAAGMLDGLGSWRVGPSGAADKVVVGSSMSARATTTATTQTQAHAAAEIKKMLGVTVVEQGRCRRRWRR